MLDQVRCEESTRLAVADRRAATHPAEALKVYLPAVEKAVARANTADYERAADLLVTLRGVCQRAGRDYGAEVDRLKAAHSRKRNFMAVLRQRGLWLPVIPMRDDDQVLLNWLESLPEEGLARLLAARPESLEPPWPRHLRALAERIGEPEAVTMTIRGLPTPAVQVLRAIAALPVGATREALASFLGLAQDDPDLAQTLATLAEHGLAWGR